MPRPFRLWPLLALCASVASEEPPAVTTAPIYLPFYNQESWSLFRGSIIGSDPDARHTTYTIFCPDDPPACKLSLEFPFVFVEGPDTIEFHGTYTSTYIADLECDLDGTTAATCSGYSSFKIGYDDGVHSGPTELSWTSTFTGSDVEWGVLTMAPQPKKTDDSYAITGTLPYNHVSPKNTDVVDNSEALYSAAGSHTFPGARLSCVVAALVTFMAMVASL